VDDDNPAEGRTSLHPSSFTSPAGQRNWPATPALPLDRDERRVPPMRSLLRPHHIVVLKGSRDFGNTLSAGQTIFEW